ncbi:hypothetical protein [uncultured Desulfosarcina sp.]|uniref:hypothetical protein n=1 Tax=uncultured Desulfosarcina sp. TaxID=218289 RepID=UPI0029C76ECA|nr:hypothetical protein [uncultured Desulfosarcina sp.]
MLMQTTPPTAIIKGCTTSLIVASLVMLQVGCTAAPQKFQLQANMSQLAIVAVDQAPKIQFEGFSGSKGQGAMDTIGMIFGESLQGGELGVLLLPITLPFGAAIGAALAPSADTVNHAEEAWSKDFENRPLMYCLPDLVMAAAKHDGTTWQPVSTNLNAHAGQPPDYTLLADAGVENVLELAITRISAEGDSLDAPLALKMLAHARLLRTVDNAELFSTDAEYKGDRHTRSEWAANKSKLLLDALSEGCGALGRHIYENVFVLYPFPDQQWHSCFPRGTLGLAPVDPPLGFSLGKVKNLRPTLRWQRFPRDSDIKVSPKDMGRVKKVSYDLFVAERHGNDLEIIYQRQRIPNPEHTLDISLRSKTDYLWSVRARFEFDGRERVTEWSGLALGMFPKFDRRLIPPLGNTYRFETP